jgi:hypothetical protein
VVPTAIHRALLHRDGSCRFPGCNLRICDAHHVEHWADGGATTLDNLVLLCRRHHRAVHEEGFTMKRLPDDGFAFFRPDGRPLPDSPPMPEPGRGFAELVDRLERGAGIADTWTTLPTWDGGPVDYGLAIEALHPLCRRA